MGKFKKVERSTKKGKKTKSFSFTATMKNFFVKNMWCLIAIGITAIYIIGSMFGIRGNEMPANYYQTGNHDNRFYTVCVYEVSLKTNQEIDSVWINLGSIDYKVQQKTDDNKDLLNEDGTVKTIEIHAGSASNSSTSFTVNKTPLKINNIYEEANIGGYQLLYEPLSSASKHTYIAFATKNTIKVNEIVVVGHTEDADVGFSEYEILEVKAYGSGAKGETHSTSTTTPDTAWSVALNVKDTLDKTDGKAQAQKLIYEDSLFNLANLNDNANGYENKEVISKFEYEFINSSRNVANGEGQVVINDLTSFGALLMYLGMLIGGAGSFGIKFFAVLFGAGTVLTSYFIANKFNKGNKAYSLIVTALVAIALFFGAVYAFNFMPALFFFSLAELFIINYVFDKTNGGIKGLVMLMLSGLAFSLSITLNAFAMFTVLPLGAGVVMGTMYRNKGSYNSMIFVKDIIISAVSFLVLPCLILLVSFIPAFGTLGVIFDTTNAFEIIAKQFLASFIG